MVIIISLEPGNNDHRNESHNRIWIDELELELEIGVKRKEKGHRNKERREKNVQRSKERQKYIYCIPNLFPFLAHIT